MKLMLGHHSMNLNTKNEVKKKKKNDQKHTWSSLCVDKKK